MGNEPWYKTELTEFNAANSKGKAGKVVLNERGKTNLYTLEDPNSNWANAGVKTDFSNVQSRRDANDYMNALMGQSSLYSTGVTFNNQDKENRGASTIKLLERAGASDKAIDEYKNTMNRHALTPGLGVDVNSEAGQDLMGTIKKYNLPYNYDVVGGKKRLRVQNESGSGSRPQRSGFTGNFA
mgnify:CR=1 FL=1